MLIFSYSRFMNLIILLLLSSVSLADGLRKLIFKCCRKGEELHSNGRDCVQRPDHKIETVDDKEDYLGDAVELKSQSIVWLPLTVLNKLPDAKLLVNYRTMSSCESQNFLLLNTNNTDRYTFSDDYSLNVSFTNLDGEKFIIEFQTSKYCLDSISGSRGPHVFRICKPNFDRNVTVIRKCCYFGQHIQISNNILTCEVSENNTWSVQDSVFRSYFPNNVITDIMDNSKSLCSNGEFKMLRPSNLSTYFSEDFKTVVTETENRFALTHYGCLDYFAEKNQYNEAIGTCYQSSKPAFLYLLVFRHFPLPVAIALVLGLIILGSRSDISETVHGKALLCHISSLCIGHIIYAIWIYSIYYCEHAILIVLNFFMMSSVLWLNAICFNIAKGLGSPLEARQKRNRWTVFAWYSLYVWGCSLLHTVLLITQPWRKYSERRWTLYLYHTKSCLDQEDWINSTKLDAVYFYYGPVNALLIINVCFVLTSVFKIRKMERNTSILQRRLSVNIINKHKTSLKYVRLLLTTGIAETAAEMAALWVRVPRHYNADGSRLMDFYIWYLWMAHKEYLFRILAALFDLLRALSLLALGCSTGDTLRRIRKGSRALWETVSTRCKKQKSDSDVELNVYTVNR